MPERFDETDAVLARKLAEIAPPASLRARLLAVEPHERATGWWSRGVSALAAVILVTLAILSLFQPPPQQSLHAATAHFASFLAGDFELAMRTSDLPQIESWLARSGVPIRLPSQLDARTPLGCRTIRWRGLEGALVCFSMKDGTVAHLVMLPSEDVAATASPQFANIGKWNRAAWSADGMTYLLFAPADSDAMRELFAAGRPLDRRLLAARD